MLLADGVKLAKDGVKLEKDEENVKLAKAAEFLSKPQDTAFQRFVSLDNV